MRYLDPNAAIKSLFSDEQWLMKTGLGGMAYASSWLLLMINVFFLPLAIIFLSCCNGYLLRVMRAEVRAQNAPLPNWTNFADLFVSGLTWTAVGFFFSAAAVAAAVGLIVLFSWHAISRAQLCSPVCIAAMFASLALTYALVSFLLTFLMVNMAVQETDTAGFQILQVLANISRRKSEFLAAWLTGEGLKAMSFWVPITTIFGAFLLPSTTFIAQVAAAKLAAQVWQKPSVTEGVPEASSK